MSRNSIYHYDIRAGVRGGRDQFKWSDVKTNEHRECYLGNSFMAPVGRWQVGKDLTWYAKHPTAIQGQRDPSLPALGEVPKTALELEREAIREKERAVFQQAMGSTVGHISLYGSPSASASPPASALTPSSVTEKNLTPAHPASKPVYGPAAPSSSNNSHPLREAPHRDSRATSPRRSRASRRHARSVSRSPSPDRHRRSHDRRPHSPDRRHRRSSRDEEVRYGRRDRSEDRRHGRSEDDARERHHRHHDRHRRDRERSRSASRRH